MTIEIAPPSIVSGRACGTCSMCCKLPQIDELDKPAGVWCRHCVPGKGCAAYDTRPLPCRVFHCAWITDARLGDEWRPTTARMIAFVEKSGSRLAVRVDPDSPNAWRREPYYGQLKQWARSAVEARRQVVVYVKRKVIVILPDRDVDFGDVELGARIWVGARQTPAGPKWHAVKVPADVAEDQERDWIARQP